MYYCNKCKKEIEDDLVVKINNRLFHKYKYTTNLYQNQEPGTIGYCPVTHTDIHIVYEVAQNDPKCKIYYADDDWIYDDKCIYDLNNPSEE